MEKARTDREDRVGTGLLRVRRAPVLAGDKDLATATLAQEAAVADVQLAQLQAATAITAPFSFWTNTSEAMP